MEDSATYTKATQNQRPLDAELDKIVPLLQEMCWNHSVRSHQGYGEWSQMNGETFLTTPRPWVQW